MIVCSCNLLSDQDTRLRREIATLAIRNGASWTPPAASRSAQSTRLWLRAVSNTICALARKPTLLGAVGTAEKCQLLTSVV
jgi:hypothetical protein